MIAQGLEGGGSGFQGGGVDQDVIAGGDAVEGDLGGSRRGSGYRRDGDIPVIEVVEGGEHHGCASLLALGTVAGDVGGGDDAFLE